jgi:hypothetical protein
MPVPPWCVPNPFIKHMISKRRCGPNLPCQMSHLRCPSRWGFKTVPRRAV